MTESFDDEHYAQVTVSIPLDTLKESVYHMRLVADDLKVELENRYPKESRDRYSSYKRRYNNEMDIVNNTLRLAEDLENTYYHIME